VQFGTRAVVLVGESRVERTAVTLTAYRGGTHADSVLCLTVRKLVLFGGYTRSPEKLVDWPGQNPPSRYSKENHARPPARRTTVRSDAGVRETPSGRRCE